MPETFGLEVEFAEVAKLRDERDQLRKDLAASGDFNARVVYERDRYRQALGEIAGGTCGCYDDEGSCDACVANRALQVRPSASEDWCRWRGL